MKKILDFIIAVLIFVFIGLTLIGSYCGLVYYFERDNYTIQGNYVAQEELQEQFGGYDDLEEYLEEVILADLAEEFERLEEQIRNIRKQAIKIAYGEFIGINSYGDKSYHVILVNGIELETIGDKNYTFVMSEKVIVLILGGTLYSIPLREANKYD